MKIKLLKSNIELENDRVLLIPFDNKRNEELKDIIFDKEIWEFMGMSINNEQGLKNYISKTIKDKNNRLCYPFLIIDKETNKVAGCTRYGNVNSASKKCEIGWTWYGTEFQGTGLNKACKFELLKFGFETIGFKRIQFSTDQDNLRSQKAIENLGAQKEGVFRNNYVASNGKSRNDVYYSIIKEEWQSLKDENFSEFIEY
ncbi:GNAT family protein [uncultured Winogradskyella sp.]|uniref:GNAT family N-acetyltransferase n=1 Tax=uncultured Winogradskyella sp. TaxID=395353 RepID=UPI0026317574|nr:GNAT family protein [uncultured Winogradskyella sp.]|tara:strand:+ start:165 stop:764 length:600 start_codon:yes stop_codon:yes gene_type:complete